MNEEAISLAKYSPYNLLQDLIQGVRCPRHCPCVHPYRVLQTSSKPLELIQMPDHVVWLAEALSRDGLSLLLDTMNASLV